MVDRFGGFLLARVLWDGQAVLEILCLAFAGVGRRGDGVSPSLALDDETRLTGGRGASCVAAAMGTPRLVLDYRQQSKRNSWAVV